ncbi:MAG: SdpA family antimicrobial peptide system protein [Sediminicola sp.]
MKRYYIWFVLLIALFWAITFYFVVISHYKYTPLNISKVITLEQTLLTPQGWGFFTRSPREEQLYVYRVENGDYTQFLDVNFSAQNVFGFSRKNRIMLNEIVALTQKLDDSLWVSTREKNLKMIEFDSLHVMANKSKIPLLCGIYIIKRENLLPWAWREYKGTLELEKKYIWVKLDCNR